MRLDIRRIGSVKKGEDAIGNRTRVRVVKNKLAAPFQKVEFDIRYGEGIDVLGDILDNAVECGVIEKSGAYYRFGGSNFAQGRERARQALLTDAKLREKVEQQLRDPAEPVAKAA